MIVIADLLKKKKRKEKINQKDCKKSGFELFTGNVPHINVREILAKRKNARDGFAVDGLLIIQTII